MKVKSIEYDGAFPNLCSGTLKVVTSMGLPLVEKVWVFPSHCLSSGGGVWFDDDYMEHVDHGEWSVTDWPDEFPEELRGAVEDMVNLEIPQGCCGGCV